MRERRERGRSGRPTIQQKAGTFFRLVEVGNHGVEVGNPCAKHNHESEDAARACPGAARGGKHVTLHMQKVRHWFEDGHWRREESPEFRGLEQEIQSKLEVGW